MFHELWKDGDEVVRTRLRELLLRMEEVAPDDFASQVKALTEADANLEGLWGATHVAAPRALVKHGKLGLQERERNRRAMNGPVHVSQMKTPESLPDLDDALRSLDE